MFHPPGYMAPFVLFRRVRWDDSYPSGESGERNACLVCYSVKGAIHFANSESLSSVESW